VHRIGRTGRAGDTGVSITFLSSNDDKGMAKDLIDVLTRTEQPIPEELYDLAEQKR
jgi:superfamily II DNA/RNA helicase